MRAQRTNHLRFKDIVIATFKEFSPQRDFAIMQILGLASRDGRNWLSVTTPPTFDGPWESGGTVIWTNYPSTISEQDDYWQLGLKHYPYEKSDSKPRWRVEEMLSPLVGILEHELPDEFALRQILSGPGLRLGAPPLPRMLIPLPGEKQFAIGPIKLEETDLDRWRIPSAALKRPLPVVKGAISSGIVRIEGVDQLVTAPLIRTVVEQSTFRDWRPDDTFFGDMIDRIAGAGEAHADQARAALEQLAEIAAASDDESLPTTEERRRLLGMVESTSLREAQRATLVNALAGAPAIADLINQRLDAELATVRLKRLEALDQELAGRRRALQAALDEQSLRLEQIAEERRTLVSETHSALDRLEQAKSQIDREMPGLVATLPDLAAMKRESDQLFLDVRSRLSVEATTIVDQAIQRLDRAGNTHSATSIVPPTAPMSNGKAPCRWTISSPFVETSAEPLEPELEDAMNRLLRNARARTVSEIAAWKTVAALFSHAVPILHGHRAVALLEVIADTFCGGDMLLISTSPTMLEPADLLGRPRNNGGAFIPASPLLDALLTVGERDRPALVVIEGANRAPVESFLLPLIDLAIQKNQNPYCLMHPRAISDDDPYREAASLMWPSNVLLAMTVLDAKTAIPLPAEIWKRGLLVVEHQEAANRGSLMPRAKTKSATNRQRWAAWRSAATAGNDELEDLLEVDRVFDDLDESIRELGERFGGALRYTSPGQNRFDEGAAIVASSIGPWFVEQSASERYRALKGEMDISISDVPMLQSLTGRAPS